MLVVAKTFVGWKSASTCIYKAIGNFCFTLELKIPSLSMCQSTACVLAYMEGKMFPN
jgi:hypothetical protein